MPPLSEIRVPHRKVPRYLPERLLPPYRYVPGVHPHPVRDPAGHSYDPAGGRRRRAPWDATAWRNLADWLWGVDLFNEFFFWEAHEAWEGLWAAKARHEAPAVLLQGLIQTAAAMLKVHLGSIGGAARLSGQGLRKIAAAAAVSSTLLGLDLGQVFVNFQHYFRPLSQRTLPPLDETVPLLLLASESNA